MKHNEKKLELLNSSAKNYYYSIDNRSYVHSTTIMTHIFETLKSNEVTVCLHKMIQNEFTYSDYPDETDFGSVLVDNTVLFLKSTNNDLSNLDLSETNDTQKKLISIQNLVISKAQTEINMPIGDILSKKIWIHTSVIPQVVVEELVFNFSTYKSYYLTEVTLKGFSFWKQYGIPNKRV